MLINLIDIISQLFNICSLPSVKVNFKFELKKKNIGEFEICQAKGFKCIVIVNIELYEALIILHTFPFNHLNILIIHLLIYEMVQV